jgi:hypothetical protein
VDKNNDRSWKGMVGKRRLTCEMPMINNAEPEPKLLCSSMSGIEKGGQRGERR